jgi:hypothetical protein
MPSTFAWVDFTDSDRRKMLDVLDLFSEHETRDEMGLGTIRDAFADYFFPGTSTIQTRARYMLFIPWLFRDLERKNLSAAEYTAQARQVEIQLIYSLLEGGDIQGVIGQDAKKSLRRLPSDIYWAGLGSWGIRQFQGSRSQYFRYLPTFYRSKRDQVKNDDNEVIDQVKENWHLGIPKSPEGLMSKADFNLTDEEANYIAEMITYNHRYTLLGRLIGHPSTIASRFFWNEPVIQTIEGGLQQVIQMARNFSESMLGALLLYNLMLAEKRQNDDLIVEYKTRIQRWIQVLMGRWEALIEWHANLNQFWTSPPIKEVNIPFKTNKFVETWLDNIFTDADIWKTLSRPDIQLLIKERERQLKGQRARLLNDQAIWNGAAGTNQLAFRWPQAQTILNDINKGLTGGLNDA